jgi:thiol:disulfide interchange protein DsbA
MFQLAYVTAQILGVAQQTHDAMFDAVWKGGDLSITDTATRALKTRMPTIEDAAKFYSQHAGVPVEKFIAASKSFSVDLKVRTDEDLIMGYKVDRTPTIIVNGKYRLHVESAGGTDQLIDLVKYLVAKETK